MTVVLSMLLRTCCGESKSVGCIVTKLQPVTKSLGLSFVLCLVQAVIEQVRHDHALLKERVARLGGPKAAARLEAGLAAARAAALAQASASNSPSASPNSSPAKSPASSGSLPASPEAVPRSPMAGAPAAGEVDENEGMAWELLYNLKWQLPTEELEAGWKDATGATSVMKVCTPSCCVYLHTHYHAEVYIFNIHPVGLFIGLLNVTAIITVSQNSFLYVCCKASAVDDLSPSTYMID